ncbi:hypothetical protein D3C80_1299680 [compost metagenome]
MAKKKLDAVIAFAKLLEVAAQIAEGVDQYERELGRPVKETYKHPSLGTTEENGLTVNVRLLNQLRKAVKDLT